MSKFIVAALAAIVAGASLWGWGWAVRRCARNLSLPHALTMAVGLAAVLFLGGVLNLLRLAHAFSVNAILTLGLALLGTGWMLAGRPKPAWPAAGALLAAIPVLVAGWFVARCLLPQAAFNVHDDMEKYFAHPLLMLATGTLPANPLASLGAETLGGQAFLQAFVAANLPLPFIGAVDSYFCLLLCVTLAGYALQPGRWALGALAAELCVLAINPQLVNISAVFSAAALLMAAVFLTARAAAPGRDEPSAPVLGLLYAGTFALKSTYAPFLALHFLSLVAVGSWLGQIRLRWALGVIGWSVVFVAPWLLLHAPLYLTPPATTAFVPPAETSETLGLFSPRTLVYGATQLHYTALAIAGLLFAAGMLFATRRGWLRPSLPLLAATSAGLACFLAYVVLVVGCGLFLFEPSAATRYMCPVMIAVIPAILRLVEPLAETGRLRHFALMAACAGLAIAGVFLPSAASRVAQLNHFGTPLAYFGRNTPQEKADFMAYNHDALHGTLESKIASLQALVPAGEPLGAWLMAPFWLDYERNPVFATEPAGLSMRWAQLPPQVRYFLLQYRGYAVRPVGEYIGRLTVPGLGDRVLASRTLAFIGELDRRGRKGRTIYNDGEYVLMEFAPR